MDSCCKNCKFSFKVEYHVLTSLECRRYPPHNKSQGDVCYYPMQSMFPSVDENSWCGEYKKSDEPTE